MFLSWWIPIYHFFFLFILIRCPAQDPNYFFLLFPPKYFTVLPFTFKTVVHFESNLYTVCILCEGSFSAYGCPVAPGPFAETLSVLHGAYSRHLSLVLCFIPLLCVSLLCLDVSTCVYMCSYAMSWSGVDWFFPLNFSFLKLFLF